MYFRERQKRTKICLHKVRSKERLQAVGEDIREVFIIPDSWNIINDLGLVWDKELKSCMSNFLHVDLF